jgi:integrase
MKYKGKRGVTYTVRWVDPRSGKWQRFACRGNLAYARAKKAEVKRKLQDGLNAKLPVVTVDEFIDRLDTLMAGKSLRHTVEPTKRSLQLLVELCRVSQIGQIDRPSIMEFRAKRLEAGVSPATVNKDPRQIKSALSYAADAGLLNSNPLWRWKKLFLRVPERVIRVVEPEEFRKLLEACGEDETFRALLVVAYRQGLRRKELADLRWDAVDLDAYGGEGRLQVVNVPEAGELTKSRKVRTMPMHPEARNALAELWAAAPKRVEDGRVVVARPYVFAQPNGEKLKGDWVSRRFKEVRTRARLRRCTIHDLRRSWSTLAQRAGIDKATVKDLGGWSEVSVVERHYTGDVSEVHRRAMRRMASTA